MRLVQIAGDQPAVPLARVGADAELAADVQAQLARAGLLDPPGDGRFGPVSHWALAEFLALWGLAGATAIDMQVASALLQADRAFPVVPGDDLAGDIVRAMQAAGFWLCRHPRAVNIVYVEDVGLDGAPSRDAVFGDARLLLRIDEWGRPAIVGAWEGSVQPPKASVRVAWGQYKAWTVGLHRGDSLHEALVQSEPVRVLNGYGATLTGLFGIDQHGVDEPAHARLPCTSAGALVGRSKSGHREFMDLLKGDPRYVASKGYRFMATVLPLASLGP